MNNKAKVRKLNKSVVLGKGQGKVMSYEDIEEARAMRAAKDVIKGKGKCGQKQKSIVQEPDEPEPEAGSEVARARARARSGTHDRSDRVMESTSGTYVLSADCGKLDR